LPIRALSVLLLTAFEYRGRIFAVSRKAIFKALDLTGGLGYDDCIVFKKGMAITIKLRQIVGKFSRIIAANATVG
jgi:hypothetical protein